MYCDRFPAAKTANLSSKAIELSHLLPLPSTESIWLLKLFSQDKLSKMISAFETFKWWPHPLGFLQITWMRFFGREMKTCFLADAISSFYFDLSHKNHHRGVDWYDSGLCGSTQQNLCCAAYFEQLQTFVFSRVMRKPVTDQVPLFFSFFFLHFQG